jgi:molybdenum cofactor guanylyltransferase
MNGLIIAGGKSTRMQKDKTLLQYGNLPQYIVVQDLLRPFCKEIFISLQAPNPSIKIPQLLDAQQNIGPISALASAYEYHQSNWLVIAIDYPSLILKDIQHLANTFAITQKSCVYYNIATNFYEPYIGIYTSDYLEIIVAQIAKHQYSMQKILALHSPEKVIASNQNNITSVDTEEQYQNIKNQLP